MPANTIIQIRKGTASEWNSTNPVLASGEPGYDLTNKIFKIGDGVNSWNNLNNINNRTISGSGFVNSSFDNNVYTISVTGLQPSGDYSVDGHTHESSDITDFSSSVSGLLPITDIVAGTNISISSSGTIFTISASGTSGGDSGLTEEEVDDRVASLLVSGSGISLNYDDSANTLTIATTGLQPSGNYSVDGHEHTSSDISDFNSSVSGLLPSVSGSGFVNSSFDNNVYTISITGLQPSGNYSVEGHTHIISEVSGLQDALDNKQPSGVYASGVHNHVVSDITDFNSSVSGLLPTVSNSGDNRVLTSTGSSLGIAAENNLTFNGSLLNVTGSGIFSSNLLLNNQTANTVASFDANKNIVSLSTSTYPTLTELSRVKGVTSSIQTQLNDKASIKSAYYIGTLFN